MPRAMTAAMASAFQATVLYPAIFVDLGFLDGHLYVWSGVGTVAWNGQSWSGVGSLGNISIIEEGANIQARGITLGLSGVDSSLLGGVLQNLVQQLPVVVYLGLFSGPGSTSPINDPVIIWEGQTDQPTIEITGTSAMISLNCESRLLEMNVLVDRRYTNDDAQVTAPGDQAFMFVNSIQELQIFWGQVPTASPAV